MKTPILAFLLALLFASLVGINAAETITVTNEPAPWWQQVEEAQSLALKWIGSLTVILGALATLVAFVLGKVNELKSRVERQSVKMENQQAQITTIALNSTPTRPE